MWKITHNGVDTHSIHFHLFNVQVINRVGWDGAVKPPDPNELGWKETVRMNPLEDIDRRAAADHAEAAVRHTRQHPARSTSRYRRSGADLDRRPQRPATPSRSPIPDVDFGWEYVWHCHILGHEENDMMRPIKFSVPSELATAPVLSVASSSAGLSLSWTDGTPPTTPYGQAGTSWGSPKGEIGYQLKEPKPVRSSSRTLGSTRRRQL